MTETTFRPERRPINPVEAAPAPAAEVAEPVPPTNPEHNKAVMDRMASIRAQTGNELPQESRLQVSGNMPPQLKAALASRGMVEQAKNPNAEVIGGSEQLQRVLQSIKSADVIHYEEVTLPSLGRFYDGTNGPIDGKLHLRQMTGAEEQILATPRFVKRGSAINMIFNSCIQERNWNAENFVTPDRTFLLIYLRIISYSPEYEVGLTCPNCERKFTTPIDLNHLQVTRCPRDFGPQSLTDVLPATNLPFRYRLSTGADEQSVLDHRDRRIRNFDTSNQADDTLTYRTAQQVEEIAGVTEKYEIQKVIERLPVSDGNYLRSVVNEPPFGMETVVPVTCSSCFHEFETELPLEAGFFFPKARKGKTKMRQA